MALVAAQGGAGGEALEVLLVGADAEVGGGDGALEREGRGDVWPFSSPCEGESHLGIRASFLAPPDVPRAQGERAARKAEGDPGCAGGPLLASTNSGPPLGAAARLHQL